MIDLGVGLTWVAISAVSLKWLAAFRRASARHYGDTDPSLCDGEIAHEEIYWQELSPIPAGGPR